MTNDLIEIPNYNEKDIIVWYEIITLSKSNHLMQRKLKSMITPYEINIKKNKFVSHIIRQYHNIFSKFVSDVDIILENKRSDMVKGFKVKVRGYKLKPSFLSYMMQSKDRYYHFFNYTNKIKKEEYLIYDFYSHVRNTTLTGKFNNRKKILDGLYKVKGRYVNDNKDSYFDIEVCNGATYINGELYTRYQQNTRHIWLYKASIVIDNCYDRFIDNLQELFKEYNKNSSNWDEYIDYEINNLRKLDWDEELKKLQKVNKQ